MKKKILAMFLSLALIVSALPVAMAKESTNTDSSASYEDSYIEGEAIVRFSDGAGLTADALSADSNDYSFDTVWSFEGNGAVCANADNAGNKNVDAALVKSDTLNTDELIEVLEARPDVVYAEPNYIITSDDPEVEDTNTSTSVGATAAAGSKTNDPKYDLLWGLDNQGNFEGYKNGVDVNVDALWSKGVTGSSDYVVAVLDTGVNYNHEDLKDNMWHNEYQDQGLEGEYGYDFYNEDNDPMDDCNHGTHCAGIIGAKGNNGIGITGVNQDIKIMALKFLSATGSAENTGTAGATADAISAYEYMLKAKELGVNLVAVNNSWGLPYNKNSKALCEIIDKLGEKGVFSAFAAGNSSTNNDALACFPSSYTSEYAIRVAALAYDGTKAYFSQYGKGTVDVCVPGYNICSTVSIDDNKVTQTNLYRYMSGTSMATPMTVGCYALLKQYSDKNNLNWSLKDIKARLIGGTSYAGTNLEDVSRSGGFLDLGIAIDKPSPVVDSYKKSGNNIVISGSFFGDNGIVSVNSQLASVVSWSDSQIVVSADLIGGYNDITVKSNTSSKSGSNRFYVDYSDVDTFDELSNIPAELNVKNINVAESVGNCIYVFGKDLNSENDTYVYRYDTLNNVWTNMKMTDPLFANAGVSGLGVRDDDILFNYTAANTSTETDAKMLSTIYAYNVKTNAVSTLAVLKDIAGTSCKYYNGKIWLLGACNISDGGTYTDVMTFDLSTNTVQTVAKLSNRFAGISNIVAVGDKLYFVVSPESDVTNTYIGTLDTLNPQSIKFSKIDCALDGQYYYQYTVKTLFMQNLNLTALKDNEILITGLKTKNSGNTVVYNTETEKFSEHNSKITANKDYVNSLPTVCGDSAYFVLSDPEVVAGMRFSDVYGYEDPICDKILVHHNHTPLQSDGWKQSDGKWQYIENGTALTGWHNDIPGWEGQWFYFDNNGYAKSGWTSDIPGWDGQWFYFNPNTCVMQKGWLNDGGNDWYFLGDNGVMKTGWQYLNWSGGTNWFYFGSNGKMYKNTTTPDGNRVDENGVWA